MLHNRTTNKVLWLLTALLTLTASTTGVFRPEMYTKIVSPEILPGVIAQDLMTIVASFVVIILAFRIKKSQTLIPMIVLGIFGYFFYAYGIYVIEQIYTGLYLVYMAIFGLAFYTIVYILISLQPDKIETLLPAGIRRVSVGFLLLNPIIFYPLWISQLIPLIITGEKLEFLYSIYILDLCFIMPAFLITAYKLIKRNNLGLLVTPALFILGFTLLFPLALTEIVISWSDQPVDTASLGMFLTLSVIFLILAFVYIRKIKISR